MNDPIAVNVLSTLRDIASTLEDISEALQDIADRGDPYLSGAGQTGLVESPRPGSETDGDVSAPFDRTGPSAIDVYFDRTRPGTYLADPGALT